MGEAVAACPKRALGAGLALRIVDTFLVRASDDAIRDHDGKYAMLTEEARNLIADNGVVPDVGSFGEPALEQIWLVACVRHDGDSDLRGQIRSGPIEGDCRDGIASESAPGFLRQPGGGSLDLLHVSMKHPPPR